MNIILNKIANPLNYYNNPIEVDADDELSTEEKVKLLMNWLDDINLRQIADAENMAGSDETHYYVKEIEELLDKYQAELQTSNTH